MGYPQWLGTGVATKPISSSQHYQHRFYWNLVEFSLVRMTIISCPPFAKTFNFLESRLAMRGTCGSRMSPEPRWWLLFVCMALYSYRRSNCVLNQQHTHDCMALEHAHYRYDVLLIQAQSNSIRSIRLLGGGNSASLTFAPSRLPSLLDFLHSLWKKNEYKEHSRASKRWCDWETDGWKFVWASSLQVASTSSESKSSLPDHSTNFSPTTSPEVPIHWDNSGWWLVSYPHSFRNESFILREKLFFGCDTFRVAPKIRWCARAQSTTKSKSICLVGSF